MSEQRTKEPLLPGFDRKRFEQAPCYICGYNGAGYFQPGIHRCAAMYHGYELPIEQRTSKTIVARLTEQLNALDRENGRLRAIIVAVREVIDTSGPSGDVSAGALEAALAGAADEPFDGWQAIETHEALALKPLDVLVAVPPMGDPAKGHVVGEAHTYDGVWYWAGNDPSDHWGGPIYPTHWRPLPRGPSVKASGD